MPKTPKRTSTNPFPIDKIFKCIVVGESFIAQVSQSSRGLVKAGFIIKARTPTYDLTTYFPTVADNTTLWVSLNNGKLGLTLWDTIGMESQVSSYAPDSHVALLLISVKDTSTFSNASELCQQIKAASPATKFIVVGITDDVYSKNEVLTDRVLSVEEADALAAELGAVDYQECSLNKPTEIAEILKIATGHVIGLKLGNRPAFFKNNCIFKTEAAAYVQEAIEVAKGRRQSDSFLSRLPEELVLDLLALRGTQIGISLANAIKLALFFLSTIPREGGLYSESKGPGLRMFSYAHINQPLTLESTPAASETALQSKSCASHHHRSPKCSIQ